MYIYMLYLYILYIYDIHVVLRFFDLKVSLTLDSNPPPLDFCSDALPTELASLTHG